MDPVAGGPAVADPGAVAAEQGGAEGPAGADGLVLEGVVAAPDVCDARDAVGVFPRAGSAAGYDGGTEQVEGGGADGEGA